MRRELVGTCVKPGPSVHEFFRRTKKSGSSSKIQMNFLQSQHPESLQHHKIWLILPTALMAYRLLPRCANQRIEERPDMPQPMPQPWEAIIASIKELNKRTLTNGSNGSVDLGLQIDALTTYAQEYSILQTSENADERILANLAYLQALSAQEWLAARNSITLAVRSQDVDKSQKYTLGALMFGLASLASFGLAGIVGAGVGLLIGGRLTSIFQGSTESPEYKTQDVKNLKADIDRKMEKQRNERNLRQGLTMAGNVATNAYAARASLETLVDPFEFFIESEVELRRVAMTLRNSRAGKPKPSYNLIDAIDTEMRVGSAMMSKPPPFQWTVTN